jgi:peptidoglycan/LPS O-acetylase OafA/YrhL
VPIQVSQTRPSGLPAWRGRIPAAAVVSRAPSQGEAMMKGPSTKLSSRLPSLDGWRAVSILMVLGSHSLFVSGFPEGLRLFTYFAFDGNLGVRCFFLISGFLITWLMLRETERTGRVNLRHFYARRALRILPVYFAFILTIALLARFTPYTLDRTTWIGNLTFFRNFIGHDFTSDHLWSLSVEEQFYLLWPGLFVAFGLATDVKVLKVLTIPVLFAPISRVLGYKLYPPFLAPVFELYSFFSYFDSIAIGCGCAILLFRKREWVDSWITQRPRAAMAVGLGLLLGTHVLIKLSPLTVFLRIFLVPFGPTLQASGFAILLLHSIVSPKLGMYRALNYAWVRQIGVLSYSIYIWQQLFCSKPETFGLGPVWWMGFPGWIGAVLVVSFVSYYGLESPFLRLRARLRDA